MATKEKDKFCACNCGKTINYKECACSPECLAKIKVESKPRTPNLFRFHMIFKYFTIDATDAAAVANLHEPIEEILWKWLSPAQQESALREINQRETVS